MNRIDLYYDKEVDIPSNLPFYMKIFLEQWKDKNDERRYCIVFCSRDTLRVEAIEGERIVTWGSGYSVLDREGASSDAFISLYYSLVLLTSPQVFLNPLNSSP